jgi:hypothetical protein
MSTGPIAITPNSMRTTAVVSILIFLPVTAHFAFG